MQRSSFPGLLSASISAEQQAGILISGYKESPSKKVPKKKKRLQILKELQPEDKLTSEWEINKDPCPNFH